MVNELDFFSGTIYSDGGSTWWGTIQQRTTSIDTNTIYKYLCVGGADSVTPFSASSVRCFSVLTDANTHGDKNYDVYTVVDNVTYHVGHVTIVATNPYGFGSTFDVTY